MTVVAVWRELFELQLTKPAVQFYQICREGEGGGAVWNIILISRGREDNRLTNKLITTEITDKECAANSSPLISSLLEITKTVALSPCFCVSQG